MRVNEGVLRFLQASMVRPEILLLTTSLRMEDSCWEQRLKTGPVGNRDFTSSLLHLHITPFLLSESLISPCSSSFSLYSPSLFSLPYFFLSLYFLLIPLYPLSLLLLSLLPLSLLLLSLLLLYLLPLSLLSLSLLLLSLLPLSLLPLSLLPPSSSPPVVRLFRRSQNHPSPAVTAAVTMPCLKIIQSLIDPKEPTTTKNKVWNIYLTYC